MRVRLSYKIFFAFLLMSVAVVVLTIGSMRYFLHRDFGDFVTRSEMEALAELKNGLAEEYRTFGSWNRLRSNPFLWQEIIISSHFRRIFDEQSTGITLHHFENRTPPDDDKVLQARHPKPSIIKIGPRLFLLDAHKRPVIGQSGAAEKEKLMELKVGGHTVGWLGLRTRGSHKTPLETWFLKRQNNLFHLIGGGIILLAALISFLLSRHLLAPIKQLTDGTRALASRQFGTRITVASQDELGQLAADFNVMAKTLEKYEKMRQQWISDIAHELRTPLSIVRGEIEALQDGVRSVNRETLESLHVEVLHLNKIVNDLHELSQADSGALHMIMKSINPAAVLTETLALFQTRFSESGFTIDGPLNPEDATLISADRDRLMQVFSNILENTLRYADSPGTLTVRHTHDDETWHVSFEDSGPGVPEESLGRLFDRLYRVDKARSHTKSGSGLGLSICKSIVEAHGGTIHASQPPAGGLRIEIIFPMHQVH